ncbi:hypothetical protein AB0M39_14745 [Streptomyces sp. NPDC051907]|uniref:hypothetical protein n=1 Tax=Streptomyces sp. NPDC051907 TaxID=3155284 RepID=UPI0034202790
MSRSATSRPQALIVLSSARTLHLSEPVDHPGLPTGFFLVEVAAVLAQFEKDYDFILVTPDGKPPQIDINGLGLNFMGGKNTGAVAARTTIQSSRKGFTPEGLRKKNPKLVKRRNDELALGRRHLGRIPVSAPLPKTDKEAISIRDEVVASFEALPEKKYFSIQELVEKDRDPNEPFSFRDIAFMHAPGGHGPMADFHANPWMGELLNSLRENRVPISLICHGPVALTSARYRVRRDGEVITNNRHGFKGAKITTFAQVAERIVLASQYPKVPGKRTRLPYFVDVALKDAGYDVSLALNPSGVKVVWDEKHALLTGNGPQAIDAQAARLAKIVHSRH